MHHLTLKYTNNQYIETMERAVYIRNLMRYSKTSLFILVAFIGVMLHADLLMDIDKPHLHELKIDEAFDPLKAETLHRDSAINRKANA